MKKVNKYFLLLIASVVCSLSFVSCDKDDDDKPDGGNISDVVGVYSGGITATVTPPMSQTIDCIIEGTYDVSVQKYDDDDVTVVIPSCSYSTENMPRVETIPELIITDVDVDRTGHQADTYILQDDDFSIIVDGVSYTGSIYGTVKGSEINLNYKIVPGKMPMPINFTFSGKRK